MHSIANRASAFAPLAARRGAASASSQRLRSACKPRRASAAVSLRTVRVRAEVETEIDADAENCNIQEIESCSLGDLELMYVDALWNYYQEGEFTLSDEDYDRLKEELAWQGSGFPTLKRSEVKFVEASIAYARGEPIITDSEWNELKAIVKAGDQRIDVTALLLYNKGQQMLDAEQFTQLGYSMEKLGIEVCNTGVACTLSKTPETVRNDISKVVSMYGALAALPAVATIAVWTLLSVLVDVVPIWPGPLLATALGAVFSYSVANYTELNNAEILTGSCPCCEAPVKSFFGGDEASKKTENQIKCQKCGTKVSINRETRRIGLVGQKVIIS